MPLANTIGLSINNYDPKQLKTFADELKAEANHSKTILIVGHSNTSPKLVNLLIKKDQFKDLDESIYDTYWIVTYKNGKTKAKRMKY
jgi:phosphohistidine phosphatase SixA